MCLFPNTAYYSRDVGLSGKRAITFDRNSSLSGIGFKVPCNQCIECRLAHARSWAIRCVHESKLHEFNEFVTLTYSDENLPDGRSLSRRDTQLFMKRLRKRKGVGVRVYGCGEYSPTMWRPHYHLLLFNCLFKDKKFYKKTPRGENLYVSDELFDLWPVGMNCIGEVTFDSAAYCAGYVTKKVTGDKADEHYKRYDANGREYWLTPEFPIYSRKPGIGAGFYDKFSDEIFRNDSVIMNAKAVRPPRFYDTRYELSDPDRMVILKRNRMRRAVLTSKSKTYYHRRAREVNLLRKQNLRSI